MNSLNEIVEAIIALAKKEQHPDEVARIYAILTQVNMKTGEKMLKIREGEKANEQI